MDSKLSKWYSAIRNYGKLTPWKHTTHWKKRLSQNFNHSALCLAPRLPWQFELQWHKSLSFLLILPIPLTRGSIWYVWYSLEMWGLSIWCRKGNRMCLTQGVAGLLSPLHCSAERCWSFLLMFGKGEDLHFSKIKEHLKKVSSSPISNRKNNSNFGGDWGFKWFISSTVFIFFFFFLLSRAVLCCSLDFMTSSLKHLTPLYFVEEQLLNPYPEIPPRTWLSIGLLNITSYDGIRELRQDLQILC